MTTLFFPNPPSPSPLGLLCSRPREAAELGPRAERPSPPHRSLPTVPSLCQPPATGPGGDGGLPSPGRAGRPRGRGGPAPQARRLRGFDPSHPGDGRLVRLVPLAGGAFGRRRPTDCPGASGPGPTRPSSAPPTLFGPGAATARESGLVLYSRCGRPPGLARPARGAAAAGSWSSRCSRRIRRIRFYSVPAPCPAPYDCGASAATAFLAAACRRMDAGREALTPVAQLLDRPPTSPPCELKQPSQLGLVSRLASGVTCQC